jgi:hypothetical protein
MKNKALLTVAALVAASMDQVFRPGFQPLGEQQQQARTATISVDTDNPSVIPDSTIEGVAAADPLRATLGGAIVLALKAKDEDLVAAATIPAVSLNRRIVIVPEGATNAGDLIADLDAATNVVKSAELTFDGGEVNNAPMTNAVANGTGISTAVNGALAAAKPSFSLQSAINKLEDLIAATAGATSGAVVVDQSGGKLYLYTCPVANEATMVAVLNASSPAGIDSIAAFDVDANPASSATGQFGE